MNDKKHTPGPWVCEKWGDGSNTEGCANVNSDTVEITIVSDIPEADARLISAAPDLLAALESLHAALNHHGEWDDGCFYYNGHSASELQHHLRECQSVMSKARGQA